MLNFFVLTSLSRSLQVPALLESIFILAIGASLGSFITVLTHRIPSNLPISGRSICPGCNSQVQAKFNIPIFGYFLTGRKCKYCSISISAKYPIIELSTSILFLLIVIFSRNVTELLLWSIFLITAFPLALIDIKEKRLPNRLTGSLFFSLLLITVVDYFLKKDLSALLKTLSCSASLLIIYLLIHVVSGGGIGMGDVKLAPSLGLITGYFGIASTYISSLIGFFLGSMVGLFMMLIGKATRKSALPFGPFMILGAALGPAATTVILKFLGFN